MANPLVAGAIQRAFDAREKASSAQEAALGALMLPSAADIERLTRRVRSVSQRLEGIEDGIDRLDERLSDGQRRRGRRCAPDGDRGPHRGADEGARRAAQGDPGNAEVGLAAPGAPEGLRLGTAPGAAAPSACAPAWPIRSAARSSPSASIRCRPPSAPKTSVTASTQPTGMPRSSPTRRSVAASISTASAPALRQTSARAGRLVVEEVARCDEPCARLGTGRRPQRVDEICARGDPIARAERSARAIGRQRRLGDDEVAEREIGMQRPARADADRLLEPEIAELLKHDRGARPAHPGALDRQRLAVRGGARIAPQPAVVVEHLGLREQQLGECEGAARVAGQQCARSQRGGGVDVDGHRSAHMIDPWPRRRTRRAPTRSVRPSIRPSRTRSRASGSPASSTSSAIRRAACVAPSTSCARRPSPR